MRTTEITETFFAELSYDGTSYMTVEVPSVFYKSFVEAWKNGERFTFSLGRGLTGIDLASCKKINIR